MFSIRLVVSEPFLSSELSCTLSSSTSFLPTPALPWPNCQNAATNGDRGTSGFCFCLIHLCRCCPHCKALLWCVCLCVWVRFSLLLLGLRFSSTATDCRSILLLLPLCATAEKLSTFLAASCMCVPHTRTTTRLGPCSYVFGKKNCIWQFVRYIEQVFLVAARENRMIYIWNLIWQVEWCILIFEWHILSLRVHSLAPLSLYLSFFPSLTFFFCWSWLWTANKWVFLTWAIYF